MGLVAGTGVHYYRPNPPIDYADGVYRSAGRADVIINQGTVEIGGERAGMKLRYVKNALVGSLESPLGPLSHTEEGQKSPVDLFFDGNRQFSTTDYNRNEVIYRRTQ